MIWLSLAVFAYLLLAVNSLGDKILLSGKVASPATYAFFVGFLGLGIVVATPFLGFPVPGHSAGFFAVLSGMLFIFALYPYYSGLKRYEASRIVPATGALVPLFAFVGIYAFVPGGRSIASIDMIAFALLIAGSVVVAKEKGKSIFRKGFAISVFAAFLFGTSIAILKYAYLLQSFWSGILWSQIGGGAAACVLFLASRAVRENVIKKKEDKGNGEDMKKSPRTVALFLGNQACGAGGGLLQHIAVYLAPTAYASFVNAVQGVQYVFVFLLSAMLSRFAPHVLTESLSGKDVLQKTVAIVLICSGLILFVIRHG